MTKAAVTALRQLVRNLRGPTSPEDIRAVLCCLIILLIAEYEEKTP